MPLPHLHYATLPSPVCPRGAFLRLCRQPGCVWLDSARGNTETDARHSLVAANPLSRLRFANGRLERIDYTSPAAAAPTSDHRAAPAQPAPTTLEGDPLATLEQWLAHFGRCLTMGETGAHARTGDAKTTGARDTNPAHVLDFFSGGAVGYFSYEFGRQWEPHTPLPTPTPHFPQMDWALYDCAVVCDHREGLTHIVACSQTSAEDAAAKARRLHAVLLEPLPEPSPSAHTHRAPPATDAPITDDDASASATRQTSYMRAVQRVRDYIASGDIYLTNIGQHFHAPLYEHPADLYLRLRDLNPAPYAAYIDGGAHQILSSSPELFLRKRGQHVCTRPIKGTRPRGRTGAEDARLRSELFHSEKERAELLMIVDLERNDLGRVCEPGSVQVEALYRIETYATVHHLVADVCGTLREGTSLLELLRSTFPGGSITGAPKVRAMEIIDELEGRQRGIFCGAIGLLGLDGSLDLSIAIRTLLCAPGKDGRQVHAGVGAGLVWDSDPRQEYEETLHKAEALLKAIHAQTKPAPPQRSPIPPQKNQHT